MTTLEIAEKLYNFCKVGNFDQAQKDLFADNATSIEKNQTGQWETITGLEALKNKGDAFRADIEEHHGGFLKEPVVYGNNIFMEMGLDATFKGIGRMEMNEMCHYQVANGKIKSETFYY